uniref:Uncharacterized protein n=1 Tax=Wuchereria bancrofti TaxID=6293 RepID=A0AAF5RTV6_WUCBA
MRTINVRCNWDDLHEVCRDQLLMERELCASTSLLKQINLTEYSALSSLAETQESLQGNETVGAGNSSSGDIKPEKSSKQTALLDEREEVLDLASIRKPEKQSPVKSRTAAMIE